MSTLEFALLEMHYGVLRQDRLREAEAVRLADLARQFTRDQRAQVEEVKACTAS
jgi:hypothetical protein